MKKPAIYILLVTVLFIGVAHASVAKVAEQKAKAELTPQQDDQQRKITVAKQQLVVFKKLLSDMDTELSKSRRLLNDVKSSKDYATSEEKKQEIDYLSQDIEKMKALRDTTQGQITKLQTKIAQLQKNGKK